MLVNLSSMKRFNRHGLIALIGCSLVLLAVFQVFWIKKVYDEHLLSLRKDLDQTFRSTVMGMQDSMIQANMSGLPKISPDTTPLSIDAKLGMPKVIRSIQITKKRLPNPNHPEGVSTNI